MRTVKDDGAVDRPIFVVGAGRSGSTVFANTFARHPAVAFLTVFDHRYPKRPHLGRGISRLTRVPWWDRTPLADLLKLSEAYGFWEAQDPGFRRPMRDLVSSDVTEASRRAIVRSVLSHLNRGRKRFFAKLTGWPRIGYLNEVFPNAYFIHLVRDGRNVATSFLKLRNWKGWEGPANWRFGPLPVELEEEWELSGHSFIVLAGLYWRIMTDAVETARHEIPDDRFLEIRYEDFVEDPLGMYRAVTAKCGLEWCPSFERSVRRTTIHGTVEKWKADLNERQQDELTNSIRENLKRYGYLEQRAGQTGTIKGRPISLHTPAP